MRFMARAALGKWRVASKCVHFSGLRSTTRFTCVKVDGKRERERERMRSLIVDIESYRCQVHFLSSSWQT